MRYRRMLPLVGALAASALAAGPAAAPAVGDGIVLVGNGRGSTGHGYQNLEFKITAKTVRGMYPGLTKDMRVTFKNPYNADLVIRRIEGRVIATSRRKCRPGPQSLAVRPYRGKLPFRVPARSTSAAGVLPLAMPPDASSHCQDTTFTILLTGTAMKAGR